MKDIGLQVQMATEPGGSLAMSKKKEGQQREGGHGGELRAEEDVGLAKAFGPSRQPAYIRTLLEYGPSDQRV